MHILSLQPRRRLPHPIRLLRHPNLLPLRRRQPRDLDIVTLLEFDAIKAIDNPEFLSPEEVGDTYRPNEKVIGVSIDGDSRAYSVPMLSRHEIVNDTVGGVKIAVTW